MPVGNHKVDWKPGTPDVDHARLQAVVGPALLAD